MKLSLYIKGRVGTLSTIMRHILTCFTGILNRINCFKVLVSVHRYILQAIGMCSLRRKIISVLPLWGCIYCRKYRNTFIYNHQSKETWRVHMKTKTLPDSKVHGTNMGPTWVLSAPDGPHVGAMKLAIRDTYLTHLVPAANDLAKPWAIGHQQPRYRSSLHVNIDKSTAAYISVYILRIYVKYLQYCLSSTEF